MANHGLLFFLSFISSSLMKKYVIPLPYPRWRFLLSESLRYFSRQVSSHAMGAISLSTSYLHKSVQPTISLLPSAFSCLAKLPRSSTVHTRPGASTCQTSTCITVLSMTHPSYVSVKLQSVALPPAPALQYPPPFWLANATHVALRANLMPVDRA
jgi:hypothetical protein